MSKFRNLVLLFPVVLIALSTWGCQRTKSAAMSGSPSADVPTSWEEVVPSLIPSSEELIRRGEKVYKEVCFLCHGTGGDGNGKVAEFMVTKPRDFRYGEYKFRSTPTGEPPTPADLFRTITVGFPEYGMPSFYHLSEKDRWGLVYYIREFDTTGTIEMETHAMKVAKSPKRTPELMERGKYWFSAMGCFMCHGQEGRGDGASADSLRDVWGNRNFVPDFSRGQKVFKTGARARDIYRVLATGIGGTPMPSYLG